MPRGLTKKTVDSAALWLEAATTDPYKVATLQKVAKNLGIPRSQTLVVLKKFPEIRRFYVKVGDRHALLIHVDVYNELKEALRGFLSYLKRQYVGRTVVYKSSYVTSVVGIKTPCLVLVRHILVHEFGGLEQDGYVYFDKSQIQEVDGYTSYLKLSRLLNQIC